MAVVQSQITTIRDNLQARLRNRTATSSRPLRYAEDDGSVSPALAYNAEAARKAYGADMPVLKAPPAPPPPAIQYATWGQGFADGEWRNETFNGVDFGRRTGTGGAIVGADATKLGFLSADDALVVGIIGGGTTTHVRNNDGSTSDVHGPGAGVYEAWVKGGLSIDSTFKADFFDLRSTNLGVETRLGLNNYSWASNISYKVDFTTWWWEPTAGFSYTRTVWDSASRAQGLEDGRTTRLQAGARVGTSFDWGSAKVESSLSGRLYDDVSVQGGSVAAATAGNNLVPTDEGKIFGQLIGKLNFDWGHGLSTYVEGEARGRDHVFGAAGRVGLRYAFGQ